MQLRKETGRRVALGALGLLLTACGTEGYDLTCSGPRDCLDSELCHPDERICVQLCTTIADCPEAAESCAALSGTNNQKVCKCPTNECVGGRDP